LGSTPDSAENVDDNNLIKEYIERRIKALIHIPIDEIESYYKNNMERFAGKEFYEVKDEIEDYMVEGELKRKIAEHVEELRNKAYIRIQLENGDKDHQVK
jgi:ribosomal protein S13